MCDMTHSYVWQDLFTCVIWLIHMCDMTPSYVWLDLYVLPHSYFVTWLIHMCDMTPSYVWHDSIHMCDVTHSYFVTRLIHMCDMTPSYVWNDSTHMCDVTHSYFVTWLIHMCDMTHSYVSHNSFICRAQLISCVHYTLQHTATHCNTLQHNALRSHEVSWVWDMIDWLMGFDVLISVTWLRSHQNIMWRDSLQHTATHCNALQRTATHCNTLHY